MRGHSNLPDKTSNENTQALENHVKDKENPHGVTAEQILLNDGSTVEDAVSEIAKNVSEVKENASVDGVMSVAGGGTGKSSLTKGSYLIGNGTEDVQLKTPAQVLSDIGAAASSHNQAASTITAGTLAGQVVANATAVATLTTAQVRNIYAGTDDMTAGTTSLPTGQIYLMYE